MASDSQSPPIGLEPTLRYRFKTRGPLASTEGSPRGTSQYWEMSEETLTGPGLEATLAMPGGDWYSATSDGFGRPDVRVQFETDDGELILLSYTGLVELNDTFVDAAENDQPTGSGTTTCDSS